MPPEGSAFDQGEIILEESNVPLKTEPLPAPSANDNSSESLEAACLSLLQGGDFKGALQRLGGYVSFALVILTHLGTHPTSSTSLRHALFERVSELISYARGTDVLDSLATPIHPPLKELASLAGVPDLTQSSSQVCSGLSPLLSCISEESSGPVRDLQATTLEILKCVAQSSNGLWALSEALITEAEAYASTDVTEHNHAGAAEKVSCILKSLAEVQTPSTASSLILDLASDCEKEILSAANGGHSLGEDGLLFAEAISHVRCELWRWPTILYLMALEAALMAREREGQHVNVSQCSRLITLIAPHLALAKKQAYKLILGYRDHTAHAIWSKTTKAFDLGFTYAMEIVCNAPVAVDLLSGWARAYQEGTTDLMATVLTNVPVLFAVLSSEVCEVFRSAPKASADIIACEKTAKELKFLARKEGALLSPFVQLVIFALKETAVAMYGASGTDNEDALLEKARNVASFAIKSLTELQKANPTLIVKGVLEREMQIFFGRSDGTLLDIISALLAMIASTEYEVLTIQRILSTPSMSAADRRSTVAALRSAAQNEKIDTPPPFLQRYIRPHLLLACGSLRADLSWIFEVYWRSRPDLIRAESSVDVSLVADRRLEALRELYAHCDKVVPGPIQETLSFLGKNDMIECFLTTQETILHEPEVVSCQTLLLVHARLMESASELARAHGRLDLQKFVAATAPPRCAVKLRRALWRNVLSDSMRVMGSLDQTTVLNGVTQILAESMCRPEESVCFLLHEEELPVLRQFEKLKEGDLLEALAARPQTCVGVLSLSDCIEGLEASVPLMDHRLLSRLQTALWTSAAQSRQVTGNLMPEKEVGGPKTKTHRHAIELSFPHATCDLCMAPLLSPPSWTVEGEGVQCAMDYVYLKHKVFLLDCAHHYHALCARTVYLRTNFDALKHYRRLLEEAQSQIGRGDEERLRTVYGEMEKLLSNSCLVCGPTLSRLRF